MIDLDAFLAALRAAAEPTRIRILALCAEGELTVTELTQILGQSQPRVSRHLKLMVDAGLLERFREGTWAFYRLARNTDPARLARKLSAMVPVDDAVLARDRERHAAVKAGHAQAAAAYFRGNAAQWDCIRRLHADEGLVEERLLAVLGTGPLGDVLDVGTGTGRILELLGPRARHGLGIDLSREMLAVARANLERAGLAHCSVRLGDMYAVPADDASFDLVTFHQVLHYADKPELAIAEAARVLRPGGRAVIVDFAPHEVETLRRDHAHRRLGFADEEVEGWFVEAGLEPGAPLRIPGDPLTVMIWPATTSARAFETVGAAAEGGVP